MPEHRVSASPRPRPRAVVTGVLPILGLLALMLPAQSRAGGTPTGLPLPAPAAGAAAPGLQLSAVPAHPEAGQTVRLRVVDPPAGATDYRWDLTPRGLYPLDTGAAPRTAALFPVPGEQTVSVRVTTPTAVETGALTLTVRPRLAATAAQPQSGSLHLRPPLSRRPSTRRKSVPGARPPAAAATTPKGGTTTPTTGATPPTAGATHPTAHTHPTSPARATGPVPVAHGAADPPVSIVDFKFVPGSTTIHAGDTITWTNNGPSPHSATASNGSFDTGTLAKGQSGSHTFNQAGTFPYFCRIHPFMHGTIVVLASSTTPTTPAAGSGPSSPTSAPGSSAPGSATSSGDALSSTPPATGGPGQLPLTGMNLGSSLIVGLLLIGLGLTLRHPSMLSLLRGRRFRSPGAGISARTRRASRLDP